MDYGRGAAMVEPGRVGLGRIKLLGLSIDVSQVSGRRGKRAILKKRFDGFGQKTVIRELAGGDPFDANLLFIMLAAGANGGGIREGAEEDVFHLVEGAVCPVEFVVFADVFPDVKEGANLDLGADFFQALALEAFVEGFTVALSAARENVKYSGSVSHFYAEDLLFVNNECSRSCTDVAHNGSHQSQMRFAAGASLNRNSVKFLQKKRIVPTGLVL